MKSLFTRTAAALCVALGLLASPAQASPVGFTLNVAFDSGPLAGQTAVGSFAVGGAGCATGLCSGAFTPSNGGLLDFRITVDGVLFTASMDSDYPLFPEIDLLDNAVTFLTFFAGDASPLALSLSAFLVGDGPLSASGYYTPEEGLTSFVASDGISAAVVPEPSTALLAALGIAGVAGASRRRRETPAEAQA